MILGNGSITFRRVAGVALIVVCAAFQTVSAEDIRLEPYAIPDQFDEIHTDAEIQGGVVVFFGSDRKSFSFSPEWTRALRARLVDLPGGDGVEILYFANLKGVPSFLRNMIKKKFPQDRSLWMLLDWKGFFSKTYGFTKGALNVLIVDHEGLVVYRGAVTEVENPQLDEMVTAVRAALPENPPTGG
jgi:hypothetical protein